jgi:NTE family protein
VLVVDTADHDAPFPWCEPLPALSALAADPAQLTAFDAFADAGAPAIGWASAGGVSVAELSRVVSQMQSRVPLVLVCGSAAAVSGMDGPFAFRAPGEGALGRQTEVLLEAGRGTSLPARLRALGAERGSEVAATIGGGERALDELPAWPAPSEPWTSIDRVARIMLRRTVGLALGAGGAKGYAHIGAARALRQMGITFDYLAGCSIGGPLAAGLAIGMGPGAIKRELDLTYKRALRPTLPLQSFLSSRRIIREMNRLVAGRSWDDLLIPLAIVAVDLDRREEVVFTSGTPDKILAASMAIPGIFAPQLLDGRRLADGGLLNPVPTTTVAGIGADVVIGVKLTDPIPEGRPIRQPRRFRPGPPPILDNIVSAIDIMQWKIIEDGAAEADITIVPRFASAVGIRDFRRGPELLAAGEAATWEMFPAIRKLLPWVHER